MFYLNKSSLKCHKVIKNRQIINILLLRLPSRCTFIPVSFWQRYVFWKQWAKDLPRLQCNEEYERGKTCARVNVFYTCTNLWCLLPVRLSFWFFYFWKFLIYFQLKDYFIFYFACSPRQFSHTYFHFLSNIYNVFLF